MITIILENSIELSKKIFEQNIVYSVWSSNNSRSLGDIFLSLLQFNKNGKFIFFTHTAHKDICELFLNKIDVLIISDFAYKYSGYTKNIHANYQKLIDNNNINYIENQIDLIKKNINFDNFLEDNDVIIYPYRSDNHQIDINYLNTIIKVCTKFKLNIYTNIVENHPNYLNDEIIEGTKKLTIKLSKLIQNTNKKLIIFSNRSGILDLLYYISNVTIIDLVPNDPEWMKDFIFEKNKIHKNIYRENVYDIFYEKMDIDKFYNQINNILIKHI